MLAFSFLSPYIAPLNPSLKAFVKQLLNILRLYNTTLRRLSLLIDDATKVIFLHSPSFGLNLSFLRFPTTILYSGKEQGDFCVILQQSVIKYFIWVSLYSLYLFLFSSFRYSKLCSFLNLCFFVCISLFMPIFRKTICNNEFWIVNFNQSRLEIIS